MPDSLGSNLVGNMSFGAFYGLAFGSAVAAWSSPPISDTKGFSALQTSSAEVTNTFRTVGRMGLLFTAATGAFTLVSGLSQEIRAKKDPLNPALGSAAVGFMMGLSKKRLDLACAGALGFGAFTFAGAMFGGKFIDDEGWVEKKRRGVTVAGPEFITEKN